MLESDNIVFPGAIIEEKGNETPLVSPNRYSTAEQSQVELKFSNQRDSDRPFTPPYQMTASGSNDDNKAKGLTEATVLPTNVDKILVEF